LGQALLEQNNLERAEQCLSQAVELGELMADWSMTRRGLLPLAWLRQIQGDSAAAQGLWQQALGVVQQAESKRIESQLRVHQARLWLAQITILADESALTAAVGWAESYQQGKPNPADYSQALAQLTLAWLRLLQGQPDKALVGLEPVAATAVAGGHRDNLIKILALQALAYAALIDLERALATLQQSFELTAPEGYVRTFIDLGPPMQHLLQQVAAQGIASTYVAQLLRNFPASPEDKPTTNLVEPLNDREQSILRLMAAGLSNREIAEELYLSINTIKWYSTHIYSKLGVNSRTKAVARAQEADIL
jgi:LuxR family maltose regulon positive regulatory protein